MSFSSDEGKGGHSSAKYSSLAESVMVPAVFVGPGVDEVAVTGNWSEVDLAPTLLDLLGKSPILPFSEGRVIPISKRSDLVVDAGEVAEVEVRRGGVLVAKATGDSRYIFRNLDRGTYSVESGGRSEEVHLTRDGSSTSPPADLRGPEGFFGRLFDPVARRYIVSLSHRSSPRGRGAACRNRVP